MTRSRSTAARRTVRRCHSSHLAGDRRSAVEPSTAATPEQTTTARCRGIRPRLPLHRVDFGIGRPMNSVTADQAHRRERRPGGSGSSRCLPRSSSRAARCYCGGAKARSGARTNRCPAASRSTSRPRAGVMTAPVYEISMLGILISGPDVERLRRNESLSATLQDVGACRIRIGERSKAGTQARVRAARCGPEREARRQAVVDPGREHRTRRPARWKPGARADEDLRDAVSPAARSRSDDMFDENYVEIAGSNPVQYRSRIPRLGRPRAAAVPGSLPRQEFALAFSPP